MKFHQIWSYQMLYVKVTSDYQTKRLFGAAAIHIRQMYYLWPEERFEPDEYLLKENILPLKQHLIDHEWIQNT